jgi:hypothetical protein
MRRKRKRKGEEEQETRKRKEEEPQRMEWNRVREGKGGAAMKCRDREANKLHHLYSQKLSIIDHIKLM